MLHTVQENQRRTSLSLESLNEVSGSFGVGQRAAKQEMMQAAQAPAVGDVGGGIDGQSQQGSSAAYGFGGERTRGGSGNSQGHAMAKAAQGRPALGSGMGGMRGMSSAVPHQRTGRDAESDLPTANKVRQIGTKTFYWKNNRWIDAVVTPDEDAKATKIVQFSDRYFELARTQKAEYNQYLSQTEPVTVKIDGQVYRVEPASQQPAH